MAGGSQGTGQGWLGDRGILDSNAEFNCTVGGRHQYHLHSPGERGHSPGEGIGERWRQRQWEGRGAQGGKPPTLLKEGHAHHGGDQMRWLAGILLDNTQCTQILWSETAPGAIHPEAYPTVPGTGAQQPGCTFLLFSGISPPCQGQTFSERTFKTSWTNCATVEKCKETPQAGRGESRSGSS